MRWFERTRVVQSPVPGIGYPNSQPTHRRSISYFLYRESKKWNADEWVENWDSRYPAQATERREYVRTIASKVAEEIGYTPTFETFGWPREKYATIFPLGHHPAEETVGYVAGTLYAFRKDTSVWVHNVSEGVIVAGSHFPDVLGYQIVSETHR